MADNGRISIGNKKTPDLLDLAFYKFTIDSLPVGIITVDSQLKITSFNPWAEVVTGYSASEAIGHFCGEILHGAMCKADCPLKSVINRQNPILRVETTLRNKLGEEVPVRLNTSALLDKKGKLIGGVEAFQDISYLKALERERDTFISMIAHDMKSSLTVIGGLVLRVLKKTAQIDETQQEKYLRIIRTESGKLESMINEFLEYSRLQMKKINLEFGPVSLDRELMELLESYQIKAVESGIRLELQSDEALPVIEADALRLRRVFRNLLDNALKFSEKGDKITVITREDKQDVIIRFVDKGVGINPEDLPHIFDPFHRGKVGENVEGFGLGLAAVKAIVEAHDGTVRVESDVGKGSVFTVILPKIRKNDERFLDKSGMAYEMV